MPIRHAAPAVCAILCAALSPASAGVVTLGAARDNTLYDYPNPISNGAGQHCFTGMTAEPSRRRALIAFDVQGSLPAGVRIMSAELTLHMSKTIAGPSEVAVHRVLADWGEAGSDAPGEEGAGAPAEPGDATWIHNIYDTYYWSTRGGDYDPTPSDAETIAGEGQYSWGPFHGLRGDAIDWYEGAAPNHGWILIGDESGALTAKRFDTREHPDPSLRPSLVISFQPPCIADWNMDGAVDIRDVLGFLNEWVAGYQSADINRDGVVDTRDISSFLNEWNAGCP